MRVIRNAARTNGDRGRPSHRVAGGFSPFEPRPYAAREHLRGPKRRLPAAHDAPERAHAASLGREAQRRFVAPDVEAGGPEQHEHDRRRDQQRQSPVPVGPPSHARLADPPASAQTSSNRRQFTGHRVGPPVDFRAARPRARTSGRLAAEQPTGAAASSDRARRAARTATRWAAA